MLDVILQILSILGIIFLILLLLTVIVILLVLFFPVTYRMLGSRQDAELKAWVKARWLFGLVRVRYQYPDPGHVVAKLMCFTLYDKKIPSPENEDAQNTKKKSKGTQKQSSLGQTDEGNAEENKNTSAEEGGKNICEGKEQESLENGRDAGEGIAESENGNGTGEGQADSGNGNVTDDAQPILETDAMHGKFFQKIKKIKYTILGICDKIKEIWENISYYIELLQEESTKELFADTFFKVGKILKCIRPRHIKAEILFGTGSPDTTGYAYGVYCMLAPMFGCDKLCVTPDFENAGLSGKIEISGHVTLWVLLINGVKLILDKRLKRFVGRIRAGRKDSKKDSL